jgi:hypothetical protein
MAGESLAPEDDGQVDVDSFEEVRAKGEVRGDVLADEGEEVGKAVDGVPVRNVTDTSDRVAAVMEEDGF